MLSCNDFELVLLFIYALHQHDGQSVNPVFKDILDRPDLLSRLSNITVDKNFIAWILSRDINFNDLVLSTKALSERYYLDEEINCLK